MLKSDSKQRLDRWNVVAGTLRLQDNMTALHSVYSPQPKLFTRLIKLSAECEWVSEFLTAHQHIKGHLVSYERLEK